jgi:hypothetical protein
MKRAATSPPVQNRISEQVVGVEDLTQDELVEEENHEQVAGAQLLPVAVQPKHLKLHLGRFSFVLYRNKPLVPLTNELNGRLTFLRNLIQQPDSWNSEITPSSKGVDATSFSIPGADMEARGSFAMHQVDTTLNNLNPTTRALFGDSFNVLGVPRISTASDLMVPGSMTPSTAKQHFLFICGPMKDKRSSLENNAGMKEFYGPNRTYNTEYWKLHAIHRQRKVPKNGSDQLRLLDLAITVPQGFIPNHELLAHMDAMEANKVNGPTLLHGSHMWLTLYDSYAFVMEKYMTSKAVVAAKRAGWDPVFCLTNGLCQPTGMGPLNNRLVTCDMRGGSYLSLLGFYLQYTQDNAEDYICLSVLNQGRPLGCRDMQAGGQF